MKSLFKTIITRLLIHKAKRYLKKHHTQIIAITGSVGKTSTKHAVYHLLKKRSSVYASAKGFNTEIGLSLAILQQERSGFSSLSAWGAILWDVLFKAKPGYEKMVVEMGADQPGDIQKLIRIAPPDIAIVTNVNPVHLAEGQFASIDDIQKEKGQLIQGLSEEKWAIVNADDPRVMAMPTQAKRFTYGKSDAADLRAHSIQVSPTDLRFMVNYKNGSAPFVVPVLGDFQINVLLPAIAVGLNAGLTLEECASALEDFTLPPGRMNPIEGIENTNIIDGSYNASPTNMRAALELIDTLKAPRKIAVLGTMNELGEETKTAHHDIGEQAAHVANLLIFLAPEAAAFKQGALKGGAKEKDIYTFLDAAEATDFIRGQLQANDLVLVKGSQNRVRLERLVKVIMRHPERASQLLCRQEKEWDPIA
ncbi:UDP-N-acetylmuramoyl-tripeptide--D-alanyl-D-alanine ligase [Candidatus Peregrinibacteria bacterium]|nr:MAG: UDP-N-acetylmuramoyl-tripeptide--D-alanyl-D-alanine ligase [Candidatus Peregrinibacteria bacterium]